MLEPSGDNGANVHTYYDYDALDLLTRVRTHDGTRFLDQQRTFTYDGRGFLLEECHPEKGAPATAGCVSYLGYDVFGNPARVLDGGNDLRYRHDAAGRTTFVDEARGATLRPIKEFRYATTNQGTDLRQGKLWRAIRHNYPDELFPAPTPDLKVVETYTFAGPRGRVSKRQTRIEGPDLPRFERTFEQSFAYDQQGNITRIDYPVCLGDRCQGTGIVGNVLFEYERGLLTGVPGWADIDYHPSALWSRTRFENGIALAQEHDPNGHRRPARIHTVQAESSAPHFEAWDTGTYQYDGTGNVTDIGPNHYTYDPVSRLHHAEVTVLGRTESLDYRYDPFGNLYYLRNRNVPVDSRTNRLLGLTYDAAGNQLQSLDKTRDYAFDALSKMRFLEAPQGRWAVHLYTADDERLASIYGRPDGALYSSWTIRDLEANVLRWWHWESRPEHLPPNAPPEGVWSHVRDHVYRGNQPLATWNATEGKRYLYTDHLGTPRRTSDTQGRIVVSSDLYPYGDEPGPVSDNATLRFTGHWRDFGGLTSTNPQDAHHLDYMHARYHSPLYGRFLSTDPVGGDLPMPQSWNRYAYVLNNPIKYIDLYGLEEIDSCSQAGNQVECEGEITVTDEDPTKEAIGMTRGTGLGDLLEGLAFLDFATSQLGSRDYGLDLGGRTVRDFATEVASLNGGPLGACDVNCQMLGVAGSADDDPIYQTLQGVALHGYASAALLGTGAGALAGEGLGIGSTRVVFWRYPRAKGYGLNLLRGGTRRFGLDWHQFKLNGRLVNRPHFHLGKSKNQLGKHQPWQ